MGVYTQVRHLDEVDEAVRQVAGRGGEVVGVRPGGAGDGVDLLRAGTAFGRENEGETTGRSPRVRWISQLLDPGEVDTTDAAALDRAGAMGEALATALHPSSRHLVVTVADADGSVRNEVLVANHDKVTGQPAFDGEHHTDVVLASSQLVRTWRDAA